MSNIRKIVLDVLEPPRPDLVRCSEEPSSIRYNKGVPIFLNGVDQETGSVKILVGGQRPSHGSIRKAIEEMAGSIHPPDAIYAGGSIMDEVDTPQDR